MYEQEDRLTKYSSLILVKSTHIWKFTQFIYGNSSNNIVKKKNALEVT